MTIKNKQLNQVIEAWPVLSAAAIVMLILLTAYAKGFVGDVVKDDLATTQTIIDMNKEIAANTDNVGDHDDDVARIEKKIDELGRKVDRLVEIMLTPD